MICYKCGEFVDEYTTYCNHCGAVIVRTENFCTNPNCKAHIEKAGFPIGEQFCKFCGSPTTDGKQIQELI